jgi:hypothetical protein
MSSYQQIVELLPTIQQKLSVLAFSLGSIALIAWLVWKRRMREEHALFWFIGLLVGILMVWVDPLLASFSYALGINLPANALMFVAVLFLFALSIWLTSAASRNKQRIEKLVVHVSILNSQVQELQAALAAGKPRSS